MTATVEVLRSSDLSLDELAATANREHIETGNSAANMLEHAIRVGDALLEVRRRIPRGNWYSWLSEHVAFSVVAANYYMRIAQYRVILDAADEPITSIRQARQLLAHIPEATCSSEPRYGVEVRAEIKQLHGEGLSQRAIARDLGVSRGVVVEALNPGRRRDVQKRRKAAQRALAEQERQQAIKRALVKEGEAFNEAYAVITRLDGLLGQARKEAQTREKREAINEAHALRDKMMDTLVRALGVA